MSASAGVTVGHMLRDWVGRARVADASPTLSVRPLSLAALGFLALGTLSRYTVPVLLGVYLPTMKRLWTPTFALGVAAATTLFLLLSHLLLDRRNVSTQLQKLSYPLVSLGRNSLLVYFGSHVLVSLLRRSFGGSAPLATAFISVFPSAVLGQVVFTALLLTFWFSLAVYLHCRKIYIKA